MGILNEQDRALLAEPHLAHVATIDADGTPNVTPVWVDLDGDDILFNTAKGRAKYHNLMRDPAVAVSVVDREDDFRALWIKGTVTITEQGADEHIDRLARKYLGQDRYPFRRPGEQRVIVRIRPTRKLTAT